MWYPFRELLHAFAKGGCCCCCCCCYDRKEPSNVTVNRGRREEGEGVEKKESGKTRRAHGRRRREAEVKREAFQKEAEEGGVCACVCVCVCVCSFT